MTALPLYLLAYPRSGSNWLCYCLEVLASLQAIGVSEDYTCPSALDTHRKDFVLMRSHGHRQRELDVIKASGRPLIFILRDYMECIVRHHDGNVSIEVILSNLCGGQVIEERVDYICCLDFFHRYLGPKILVYYRDLIMNPREQLDKVLKFMGLYDEQRLVTFMSEFDGHVKKSIKNYVRFSYSATEGKAELLHYHSSSVPYADRVKIDLWLKDTHPCLYDTYLARFKPKEESSQQ